MSEPALGDGKVDDLATLVTLDEAGLQTELKLRHKNDVIYTYIGDILIAVNPYKEIPIYTEEYQMRYRSLKERSLEAPHIFAISDSVYQNLINTGQSQCCVVSGESGAGKTESTKYMVKHIAQLCHHDTSDLHERIVRVNPLLEAFGNAQTVINNNSSRFGKYIELDFRSNDGAISGAHISEYLLEKSRVVSQALGEQNFHIFYYLFAGLSQELLTANRLTNPDAHRIMRPVDGSPVFKSPQIAAQHKKSWEELMELFRTTGFREDQVDGILATLAAILHLTDIEFVTEKGSTHDGVIIKNEESMEMAADLLLVDKQSLANALISKVTVIKGVGTSILSLKNQTQANDGRDALAKALYSRMFGWTVRQINIILKPDRRWSVDKKTIGILDLAGFENFKNNSFEQLCINAANEQLHHFFNQHIFAWEMEEYKKEGIEGKDISFVDNAGLLELFLNHRSGLFAKLDEYIRIPAATDLTFVDRVTDDYKTTEYFRRPKGQTLNFVIHHYAGQVIYNADNFLEKNRDTLSSNIFDTLKNSESTFVTELFFAQISDRGSMMVKINAPKKGRNSVLLSKQPAMSLAPSGGGKGNRYSRTAQTLAQNKKGFNESIGGTYGRKAAAANAGQTMASHFTSSLNHLMGKLKTGEPHFIRCIKPNSSKFPEVFQDDLVLQQLRYTGVLETVKIRRQGYATRLPFELFLKRYKFIMFSASDDTTPNADNCRKVLTAANLKDYEIGHTKVFLRYWHTEQLQNALDTVVRSVSCCQRAVRLFLAVRELARRRDRARKERDMVRQLCADVAEVSERLYNLQCTHRDSDKERHKKKLEEARRKAKAEREAKEAAERKRIADEAERDRLAKVAADAQAKEDTRKKEEERLKKERDDAKKREEEQRKVEEAAAVAALEQATIEDEDEQEKEKIQHVPTVPVPGIPPGQDFIPGPYKSPPIPKGLSPSKMFIWELLQDSLERYTSLSSQIWAKVFYLEKGELVGKVYLRDWDVIVNQTDVKYDGKVIGLRYEEFDNPVRDRDSLEVLNQIGEGVEIARDAEGSIMMRNLSGRQVTAKDYINPRFTCLSADVIDALGQIPKWPVKVFDMAKYKYHVCQELQKPQIDVGALQMLSVVSFAFGRNSHDDFASPSWVFIINFAAIEMLGNEAFLQEMLRLGQVAISSDRHSKIRRDWQGLYRPRRQSTDSMRFSSNLGDNPSNYPASPGGPMATIGPASSRKMTTSTYPTSPMTQVSSTIPEDEEPNNKEQKKEEKKKFGIGGLFKKKK